MAPVAVSCNMLIERYILQEIYTHDLMWQRESVCFFEIDICGLHVIRFLDYCPRLPLLPPLPLLATLSPLAPHAVCQNICNDSKQLPQPQQQFVPHSESILKMNSHFATFASPASLPMYVCVCVCGVCIAHAFSTFSIVCLHNIWTQDVATQRTHVSVAPDIPDQLSCPLHSLLLLSLYLFGFARVQITLEP